MTQKKINRIKILLVISILFCGIGGVMCLRHNSNFLRKYFHQDFIKETVHPENWSGSALPITSIKRAFQASPNSDTIYILDDQHSLSVSYDFGKSFKVIQKGVEFVSPIQHQPNTFIWSNKSGEKLGWIDQKGKLLSYEFPKDTLAHALLYYELKYDYFYHDRYHFSDQSYDSLYLSFKNQGSVHEYNKLNYVKKSLEYQHPSIGGINSKGEFWVIFDYQMTGLTTLKDILDLQDQWKYKNDNSIRKSNPVLFVYRDGQWQWDRSMKSALNSSIGELNLSEIKARNHQWDMLNPSSNTVQVDSIFYILRGDLIYDDGYGGVKVSVSTSEKEKVRNKIVTENYIICLFYQSMTLIPRDNPLSMLPSKHIDIDFFDMVGVTSVEQNTISRIKNNQIEFILFEHNHADEKFTKRIIIPLTSPSFFEYITHYLVMWASPFWLMVIGIFYYIKFNKKYPTTYV